MLSADTQSAIAAEQQLASVYEDIPLGVPYEDLPSKDALGFRVPLYGYDTWAKLFAPRQLLALGSLIKAIRSLPCKSSDSPDDRLWDEAVICYLACALNKVADYNSAFVAWQPMGVKGSNTFQRWALPMK